MSLPSGVLLGSLPLYTGLDGDELERLPDTVLIHHAALYNATVALALHSVLFNRRLAALCERRLNVLMPLPFSLDDPHACPQCLEVIRAAAGHSAAAAP